MEELVTDLESFRMQWRSELTAKSPLKSTPTTSSNDEECQNPQLTNLGNWSQDLQGKDNHNRPDQDYDRKTWAGKSFIGHTTLLTALDHYEQAVERENQGNLGDSLNLYRKAFRMDQNVDRAYRLKHFPPSRAITEINETPKSFLNVKWVANSGNDGVDGDNVDLKKPVAKLPENTLAPATSTPEHIPSLCPLAMLPDEIIVQILMSLAVIDVVSFARMAQVCKRISSLVATEESIWKWICLESEVGFRVMHYEWQRDIYGELQHRQEPTAINSDDSLQLLSQDILAEELLHKLYSSSWRQMFRLRPRVRFNGCYISTVNYMRPGEASPLQVSWNSPIHIVTYYRYLRFFRDGTLISLLTTNEPIDVVHYLTKEYQKTHRNRTALHLSPKVMAKALRGRWHMGRYSDGTDSHNYQDESDVHIETEGVNTNYIYQIKLSLRSTGKACCNNKLVWQYFRSYNRLTDEVENLYLKNEKGFFWSRVKSYEQKS